jgi:hypothetical protein
MVALPGIAHPRDVRRTGEPVGQRSIDTMRGLGVNPQQPEKASLHESRH